MDKRIKQSENPLVKTMADDRDEAASLEAVALSNGGKVLVKGLTKDIIRGIERVAAMYQQLSHVEFIGLGAEMKSNIDMLRALTRAGKNKQYITDEIERLLGEELDD